MEMEIFREIKIISLGTELKQMYEYRCLVLCLSLKVVAQPEQGTAFLKNDFIYTSSHIWLISTPLFH